MTYKVADYYRALDKIAPFHTAESWDNVGLLVGSFETKVKSVIVTLDLTLDTLAEAKLSRANLIITHHPVIFPSVSRIDGDSPLYAAIAANVCVISAHTNYDAAENGVNDALCKVLSLKNVHALESATAPGLGRIGELESSLSSAELTMFIKERLGAGCVKYTPGTKISALAVCGGSGGELWRDALKQGAQAFVTSEVKHHLLIEAARHRFTLIDAGHYATEAVCVKPLVTQLSELLPDTDISPSKSLHDPANYV